jgi:predicted dienelactone hydrolase
LKRAAKIFGVTLLLVVGAAVLVVMPPEHVPAGDQSAQWYADGLQGVIETVVEFEDSSRPTAAYNDYPGSDSRIMTGRMWQPESQAPAPLVVYSHGFMSSHSEGEYIGRFLATRGYITVAVDFPLTGASAPAGPLVTDVINQPQDLSFMLDQLLLRNSDQNDLLYGRIDPQRVAAVGLSLGGLTTELVAFHNHLRDERIRVAASIAGPTANMTGAFFTSRKLPFLMLAGSSDQIVPYAGNALPILDKAPGATLVTLEAASHSGFAAQAAGVFRFANHPDEWVCPSLVSNLENAGEQPLFQDDPEAGLVAQTGVLPCQTESFARAMRPAAQVALMRLVIFSFLESELADSDERRESAKHFLLKALPAENPEVKVVVST